MNGLTFLTHLNLFQASRRRHLASRDTDATVSYFLGDIRAAIVIAIMVILAITMAFIQEHRSNDAAAKLRAMVKATARVRRRGARPDAGEHQSNGFSEISIERLVPGDIVRLSAGDMVPADLRLICAKDLFINQAALRPCHRKNRRRPTRARSAIPLTCQTSA
jgi:Mg2+-importing ATPase